MAFTLPDRDEAEAFLHAHTCHLLPGGRIQLPPGLSTAQVEEARRVKPALLALLGDRAAVSPLACPETGGIQGEVAAPAADAGPISQEAWALLARFRRGRGSLAHRGVCELIAWAPRHTMSAFLHQLGQHRHELARLEDLDAGSPLLFPEDWLSVLFPLGRWQA